MPSKSQTFQVFEHRTGASFADTDGEFPSCISLWANDCLSLSENATHFGFVQNGSAKIFCESGRFAISSGMYFSVPGSATVRGDGFGIVSSRLNYRGFFSIGGPVESTGRLRYIDGCSDSLLISPTVLGDPCLNLLHIPPATHQTRHTHPSLRSGVIVSGSGRCVTPDGETKLSPSVAFVIPAESPHSFHTDDDELLVVAWHPDSDTGPSHDDHPMVNRTIVNGVSAADIPEIRT